MSDRDELRSRLGRVGIWTFAFDSLPVDRVRSDAAEIESMGYSALWIPEGSHSRDVFAHLSLLASATADMGVCSGIANITARQPEVMQAGAVTLAGAFGDRVVLGIGVEHEYSTEARGLAWSDPVGRMSAYLDRMDAATWLPMPSLVPRRMLAALGPRMLRLSAKRALGAHTYFAPIAHTASARRTLGSEPVLAVELTAVSETDPIRARAIARGWARHYLELPNYANNWRRSGYSEEDVAGDRSDRLIDAGIAWGDADAIAHRVREHLDAGADHVCVQVIGGDDDDAHLEALRELVQVLPIG
jgi:probable F420-dependent oxidoreductase